MRPADVTSPQVLVDVRPPHIYEKAHPEGARNVPLFQKVNFRNFSVSGYLRAAALALNGVTPVEPNPDFSEMLMCLAMRISVTFYQAASLEALYACCRSDCFSLD